MKHTVLIVSLSLFAAPAFAQEQAAPENDPSVGVDYSQPFIHDLVVRSRPPEAGMPVRESGPICGEEQAARNADPDDVELAARLQSCIEDFRNAWNERMRTQRFGPNAPFSSRRPYDPSDSPGLLVRPLPLSPDHPNAQN